MAYENDAWAAIIIVLGPNDTVPLVWDEGKPTPHYWKFPGGRGEHGESVEETAIRETEEEVGLKITRPRLLKRVEKHTHTMYLFGAVVESFDGLKKFGDEGERVALFSVNEVVEMVDFFPPHRKLLEDLGVLASKDV